MPSSRGSSQPRDGTQISWIAGGFFISWDTMEAQNVVTQSCPTFCTPWAIALQAPLSMEFSRQEYWSGLPFPSPGDLSTQGSNLGLTHCRQILYNLSHKGIFDMYSILIWQIFFLSALQIYHLLPPGPQDCCWEICWWSYRDALVCDESSFFYWFQNLFLDFYFCQLEYNVSWHRLT